MANFEINNTTLRPLAFRTKDGNKTVMAGQVRILEGVTVAPETKGKLEREGVVFSKIGAPAGALETAQPEEGAKIAKAPEEATKRGK